MKLNLEAISKNDIDEYIEKHSDFSFEIKVLRKFISAGFFCEHASVYEDPITKKTREFDIRAIKRIELDSDLIFNLCFSVECKNLRKSFPLVVHCMPREEAECYLGLIWSIYPEYMTSPISRSKRILIEDGNKSPYGLNYPVGKSCDQVGRSKSGNEVIGNDSDVFSRISQAVNSSYDLVVRGHYASEKGVEVVTLVIPVLVVPDDRLWTICYNLSGDIEQEATINNNIEYFLNKSWLIGEPPNEYQVRHYISHMEIVQIGAVEDMVKKYCSDKFLTTKAGLREIEASYKKK